MHKARVCLDFWVNFTAELLKGFQKMFFDVSAKRRLPSYDGKNKPNMHRRVVWRFCVLFYIKLTLYSKISQTSYR